MKTYYLTKYALTGSVTEFEGELTLEGRYVTNNARKLQDKIFGRLGIDIFETPEDALKDVEQRAKKNVERAKRALGKAKKRQAEVKAGNVAIVTQELSKEERYE